MTEKSAALPMMRRLFLVEDSPADVQILQRILRDLRPGVELHLARDGQEAVDQLFRQAKERPVALPDLVLLDLNLPRLGGLDVLRRIRSLPETRLLPVVVWSTSRHEEDVREVYRAGGNSYIQKPRDLPQYRELIESLLHYWFRNVQLPSLR